MAMYIISKLITTDGIQIGEKTQPKDQEILPVAFSKRNNNCTGHTKIDTRTAINAILFSLVGVAISFVSNGYFVA